MEIANARLERKVGRRLTVEKGRPWNPTLRNSECGDSRGKRGNEAESPLSWLMISDRTPGKTVAGSYENDALEFLVDGHGHPFISHTLKSLSKLAKSLAGSSTRRVHTQPDQNPTTTA